MQHSLSETFRNICEEDWKRTTHHEREHVPHGLQICSYQLCKARHVSRSKVVMRQYRLSNDLRPAVTSDSGERAVPATQTELARGSSHWWTPTKTECTWRAVKRHKNGPSSDITYSLPSYPTRNDPRTPPTPPGNRHMASAQNVLGLCFSQYVQTSFAINSSALIKFSAETRNRYTSEVVVMTQRGEGNKRRGVASHFQLLLKWPPHRVDLKMLKGFVFAALLVCLSCPIVRCAGRANAVRKTSTPTSIQTLLWWP